ncbi:MAG: tetratricopeptide repeat protein [Candidatus Edwardsbacteria bacterium]
MNKHSTDFRNKSEIDWIRDLWHLHSQRLDITNLLGLRLTERQELAKLEKLVGYLNDSTLKLELLQMQIRYLMDTGDLFAAKKMSDKLVKLAKEGEHTSLLCLAFDLRAMIHREMSQMNKSLEDYKMAERLAEGETRKAEICLGEGLTLVYANRLIEGEELLQGAISVAEKYEDLSILPDAYNSLGICLSQQGKYSEALSAYKHALEVYDKTGYKIGKATVLGNMAEIFHYLGLYDEVLQSARDCVRFGQEAEDRLSIALGYEMLGRIMVDLDDCLAAADYHNRAAEILKEAGDTGMQAKNLVHLAVALARLGKTKEAQQYFGMAEDICNELDTQDLVHSIMVNKIFAIRLFADRSEALDTIEQYVSLSRKRGNKKELCSLLLERSRILWEDSKLELAQKSFEEALSLVGKVFDRPLLIKLHSFGYQLYQSLDQKAKSKEHLGLGMAILNEIVAVIKNDKIREKFLSKEEIKILLNKERIEELEGEA